MVGFSDTRLSARARTLCTDKLAHGRKRARDARNSADTSSEQVRSALRKRQVSAEVGQANKVLRSAKPTNVMTGHRRPLVASILLMPGALPRSPKLAPSKLAPEANLVAAPESDEEEHLPPVRPLVPSWDKPPAHGENFGAIADGLLKYLNTIVDPADRRLQASNEIAFRGQLITEIHLEEEVHIMAQAEGAKRSQVQAAQLRAKARSKEAEKMYRDLSEELHRDLSEELKKTEEESQVVRRAYKEEVELNTHVCQPFPGNDVALHQMRAKLRKIHLGAAEQALVNTIYGHAKVLRQAKSALESQRWEDVEDSQRQLERSRNAKAHAQEVFQGQRLRFDGILSWFQDLQRKARQERERRDREEQERRVAYQEAQQAFEAEKRARQEAWRRAEQEAEAQRRAQQEADALACLRLAEEAEAEQRRCAEEEANLARLRAEAEEEEARLRAEREEEEARLRAEREEEEARFRAEREKEEARLRAEEEEEEARLWAAQKLEVERNRVREEEAHAARLRAAQEAERAAREAQAERQRRAAEEAEIARVRAAQDVVIARIERQFELQAQQEAEVAELRTVQKAESASLRADHKAEITRLYATQGAELTCVRAAQHAEAGHLRATHHAQAELQRAAQAAERQRIEQEEEAQCQRVREGDVIMSDGEVDESSRQKWFEAYFKAYEDRWNFISSNDFALTRRLLDSVSFSQFPFPLSPTEPITLNELWPPTPIFDTEQSISASVASFLFDDRRNGVSGRSEKDIVAGEMQRWRCDNFEEALRFVHPDDKGRVAHAAGVIARILSHIMEAIEKGGI